VIKCTGDVQHADTLDTVKSSARVLGETHSVNTERRRSDVFPCSETCTSGGVSGGLRATDGSGASDAVDATGGGGGGGGGGL